MTIVSHKPAPAGPRSRSRTGRQQAPTELLRAVQAPGRRARLTARVHARALDRALAAGADPAASAPLAARAALLTSPGFRASAAEGLERLLRGAQGPHRRWWALARHTTVLANSSELAALASLLHSDRPAYARGIAILNLLLTDGTGAAYQGGPSDLARELRAVRTGMDG